MTLIENTKQIMNEGLYKLISRKCRIYIYKLFSSLSNSSERSYIHEIKHFFNNTSSSCDKINISYTNCMNANKSSIAVNQDLT